LASFNELDRQDDAEQLMEGPWVKTILAVFGILFAIGGAVSAFLQAKWLRDQRKTLRAILGVLQTMRGNDIKEG
jgi:hypothetical protein